MNELIPKYFDYLPQYGDALQVRLKRFDLTTKIPLWRKTGTQDPNGVVTGCRNIAERMLRVLIDDRATENMTFIDLIDYAKQSKIIDKPFFHKLNELRRLGNNGAHNFVNIIDAQMALELLDDILRSLIIRFDIDTTLPPEVPRDTDSIFVVRTTEEIATLSRKARTAALISGDNSIERDAKSVKATIEKQQIKTKDKMKRLTELLEEMRELTNDTSHDEQNEIFAFQAEFFSMGDKEITKLHNEIQEVAHQTSQVEERIEEILSEYDFIEKLLQGQGKATDKQFEVMAFPRTSKTSTTILQIAGGAGTGKTLCLLAKLISDIRDSDQLSLFGSPQKKALFICFNKSLRGYVKELLAKYPQAKNNIEVASYDTYINQLVRMRPSDEFAYLSQYANDTRYWPDNENGVKKYWKIAYGEDLKSLLKNAMNIVAQIYPLHKDAYYLNSSSSENIEWMLEEMNWLEARYNDESEAIKGSEVRDPYLTTRRIGRGTKRRPNEEIRGIILIVWAEFRKQLEASRLYTIEQATKRLLSSTSLPKYDAIAIDEIQDFNLKSIQLMLKFRASEKSRIYLSGDENQKIYQRDFTWKELDSDVRGHTITLSENKRNTYAISRFAERLNGIDCQLDDAHDKIHIQDADTDRIIALIKSIAAHTPNETTAIIGNVRYWQNLSTQYNLNLVEPAPGKVIEPGFYIIGDYACKGLEFDNVIVDYTRMLGDDIESEKRLRYVHFTRARKRLYVRYAGEPPELLQEYYADFL